MVKALILCAVLFFSIVHAEEEDLKALLDHKIQSIIDQRTYTENKAFIDIIFTPTKKFIIDNHIDTIKVLQTLKENGLLELFFHKPTKMQYSFISNTNPVFFVKIVGDSLRNIGYFRFVTQSANYSSEKFEWNVNITSEYAIDPVIFEKELAKTGCKIVDVQRLSKTHWSYMIDMTNSSLNAIKISTGKKRELKRSLTPYWFDVSAISKLRIVSKAGNSWFPDISYYDEFLHIVKVTKKDRKIYDITVNIPKNAKYIKISDIYTMKNLKNSLILYPSGSR
ncbi:MAG: hypothetical protein GXO11_00700 [Epsilonproteobacteria bacterium]|nr:hypothetical protein [Campylobacterota bacterium]